MSQILTLTLNPVLDRILYVENFDFKHITRIDNALESSGGKGLNVSKALKKLGIQSQAIGVFGGLIGQKVTSLIEKENLNYYPIHINGETRTNTAVYSTNTLERIKLDEKGPRITDIEKQKILSTIKQLAIEDQIWVISGSLPQGLNHDFYVEITNLLNTVGVKTIVDASGEALKQIVKTKPFLIKPNDEEGWQKCCYRTSKHGSPKCSTFSWVSWINSWKQYSNNSCIRSNRCRQKNCWSWRWVDGWASICNDKQIEF
jgi:1-phosphofructokinase